MADANQADAGVVVEADVEMIEKPIKKRVSQTERAGLTFSVGRINRKMRKGRYAKLIGKGSAVYLAAVCEYLVAEVLEMSGTAAHDKKRSRINPRHITLAVRNDSELNELLKDVTFSEGGVKPNIHDALKHRTSPFHSLFKKSSQGSSRKSSQKSSRKPSQKSSRKATQTSSNSGSYNESVEL